MANLIHLWFSYVVLIFITTLTRHSSAAEQERQFHIVHMGARSEGEYSPSSGHLDILERVVDVSSFKQSLVRSYARSFNAFAANLTDQERQRIASLQEVVSVFPSRSLKTQTTRSWDFMGFTENNVALNPNTGSDVIVGVIDTGIWPESDSFSDEGFGPVPSRWKGACQGGRNFTCNKKIIGACYYTTNSTTENTAPDTDGHGTHTASTAAGNIVKDASFYGLANGTARGGLPSARIAVYKVCYDNGGCPNANIMAAFDDAIADGVDIITISIGTEPAVDMFKDSVVIGAFHAMERGILTLQSAGNAGPEAGTVESIAPWILTVAASTTDRRIVDKVSLGNGTTLIGNAVNSFKLNGSNFPLIFGKAASRKCDEPTAEMCNWGCLDPDLVKGKIVLCNQYGGLYEAQSAGAHGSIVPPSEIEDVSIIVPFPASILCLQYIELIQAYINSTKMPQANISKSESIRDFKAPVVASFSSREPNKILPDILKPDISAPGVDILAAYSPAASPTSDDTDKRSVKYNILSGTSMACPHTAGAAAYLKSMHPDWSPSAIKSALMTTAWQMYATQNNKEAEFAYGTTLNVEAELAYGSGHIDPVKAANPGLVYETFKEDYVQMLCNMNYNISSIRNMYGDNNISCPEEANGSSKDLNYPSMAFQLEEEVLFTMTFSRTVTNVGTANSTYKAKITTKDLRLDVSVEPRILTFQSLNERKSFVVNVFGNCYISTATVSLVWSDGVHSVRSPIILYRQTTPPPSAN